MQQKFPDKQAFLSFEGEVSNVWRIEIFLPLPSELLEVGGG